MHNSLHNTFSHIRLFVFAVLCCALFIGATSPADAAVIRGGETYRLSANTVLDGDFYFFGDTLVLMGTTTGDVLAIGSQADVLGPVGGDVLSAVGRGSVSGVVDGDVRIAGGVVLIEGTVKEDLVVVGGTVTIAKGARVLGDVLIYGDRFELEGEVAGMVEVYANSAVLEGVVGHDAVFTVNNYVRVGMDAQVGGDFVHTAPNEARVPETASVTGDVVYTQLQGAVFSLSASLFSLLLQILLFVVGVVLLAWVFPGFVERVATRALSPKSGWLVFRGFVFIFALPVIAVFAMVSVLGVLPGLLLLLSYLMVFVMSLVVAPLLMGAIFAYWLKQNDGLKPSWASIGAIVFVLLSFVPLFGWLMQMLFVTLAFGTVLTLWYEDVWMFRKKDEAILQKETGEVISDTKEEKAKDDASKDESK